MSTLLLLFSSMSWVNIASKTELLPARMFLWHLNVLPSQVMQQSANFPLVKIALNNEKCQDVKLFPPSQFSPKIQRESGGADRLGELAFSRVDRSEEEI